MLTQSERIEVAILAFRSPEAKAARVAERVREQAALTGLPAILREGRKALALSRRKAGWQGRKATAEWVRESTARDYEKLSFKGD